MFGAASADEVSACDDGGVAAAGEAFVDGADGGESGEFGPGEGPAVADEGDDAYEDDGDSYIGL